jgi:hypothetical protein
VVLQSSVRADHALRVLEMVYCRTNDDGWRNVIVRVDGIAIPEWKDAEDDLRGNGDGFGFVVAYADGARHLAVTFGQVSVMARIAPKEN